jgi:hypothetical protein
MAKLTPVQEALHALRWNLLRSELPAAAQPEGDRLNPDRKWQAARGRRAAGARAAWRVVPSARWYRFALVTIILGMLTGFYGTVPAAFVIFHLDNVPAAAHYSGIQDLIVLAAFGILIGGASLTLYFTVRFAKRPSIATSAFGVTVFNWKTVTLPWDNITDVVLTPATRFTRRGWVPGIVQRDGQVLPVAFAEFRPSGGQAQGPAPEMRASGGVFGVSALIPRGAGWLTVRRPRSPVGRSQLRLPIARRRANAWRRPTIPPGCALAFFRYGPGRSHGNVAGAW